MAFEYHSENGKTLTKSQEDILEEIENLPFFYGGIDHLKNLRKRTGVSVVISDRMSLIRILSCSISSIKAKIEEYKTSKVILNGNVEGEIYHRLRWAERQLKNAEQPSAVEMPLLGLYTRKLLWLDNSAPVVYLFADNIKDYAANHLEEMDEDNVFAFVFVHEMMHAYYDAFNSIGFPAKEPIEEAFAEFGMLSFLYKSYGSRHPLFDQARFNVCSKIEYGLYEYGFGLELFELSERDGTNMIQKYRDKSNWIDYSVINKEFHAKGLGNYFVDIAHYKDHHDDDDLVEKCFKDVQDILNYPWQQPSITVQPRVSICRASSITSPANPSGRKYPISLVYCSPAQTEELVCLIRDKEIETILAAIIRVLKNEGFESGLSLYGRHVKYLGKELFYHTTSPQRRTVHSIVVPESICVSGTIVLPMFIGRGLNSSFGGVLRLLSELVGDSFVLVREAEGYGLYGPPLNDEYMSLLKPEMPRYDKFCYEIIVRATSEVLGHEEKISRVPLLVVKHFCENNKDVTWTDLQQIFDRVECHMPTYLDWITPKPIVDAYYTSFPKSLQRFHKDPITLASGETILVASHSIMPNSIDYKSFIEVADRLGYDIIKSKIQPTITNH